MATPSNSVAQVPRLTTEQIAQFKRDGFLVLPAVLDLELCRQTREQMWELIAEHRPSMKRDDPATWLPFSDEERAGYERPEGGGDPYFGGGGHRLYIRNGAEELLLDLAPRAMFDVAEQLLGEGEVIWPNGLDETNTTIGPALLTEDHITSMEVHLGPESDKWLGKATRKTEQVRLPKTGPVWATAQGSRGLYCTLPNSPGGRVNKYPYAKVQPSARYPSAHAAEGMYESRRRLQIAAYFDYLPLGAGGLHLWPGSHQRIWDRWSAMHRGDIPSNDADLGDQGRHAGRGHPRTLRLGGPLARQHAAHGGPEHQQRHHPSGHHLRLRQDRGVPPGRGGAGLPGRRPLARLVRRAARNRSGELETDRREHAGHHGRWPACFAVFP